MSTGLIIWLVVNLLLAAALSTPLTMLMLTGGKTSPWLKYMVWTVFLIVCTVMFMGFSADILPIMLRLYP